MCCLLPAGSHVFFSGRFFGVFVTLCGVCTFWLLVCCCFRCHLSLVCGRYLRLRRWGSGCHFFSRQGWVSLVFLAFRCYFGLLLVFALLPFLWWFLKYRLSLRFFSSLFVSVSWLVAWLGLRFGVCPTFGDLCFVVCLFCVWTCFFLTLFALPSFFGPFFFLLSFACIFLGFRLLDFAFICALWFPFRSFTFVSRSSRCSPRRCVEFVVAVFCEAARRFGRLCCLLAGLHALVCLMVSLSCFFCLRIFRP